MKIIADKTREKNIRLYNKIETGLKASRIRAYIRQARTGNINLIVEQHQVKYSVVRFAHTRTFKIFFPAGMPSNKQSKVKFKQYNEVIQFFVNKDNATSILSLSDNSEQSSTN